MKTNQNVNSDYLKRLIAHKDIYCFSLKVRLVIYTDLVIIR